MPERRRPVPKEYNYTADGSETWKELTKVGHFGYGNSQVFRDFIDIGLSAVLSLTDNMPHPDILERLRENRLTGPHEDEYMRLVRKYRENADRPIGERPADHFGKAFSILQAETKHVGQDILGEIFMREITHGEHGQFFTPVAVCDMMAQMTGAAEGETVNDPACGSGRFFISIAKVNPNIFFTGTDVSETCAKMAVLNTWMFDLNADIYHGNSLSMEMYRMWRVRNGGYIFEVSQDQFQQVVQRRPVEEAQAEPQPSQTVADGPRRPIAEETNIEQLGQQTLFDIGEYKKPKMRKLKSE